MAYGYDGGNKKCIHFDEGTFWDDKARWEADGANLGLCSAVRHCVAVWIPEDNSEHQCGSCGSCHYTTVY